MTHFKSGDAVRVNARYCSYFGRITTITEVAAGRAYPYRVEGIDIWRFADHELEAIAA